jgi:serine protease inhibitor
MKTYSFRLFWILAVALILGACNKPEEPVIVGNWKPIPLTEKSAKVIASSNAFGLDLFTRLVEAEESKNVVISPLSVSLALAMTYNGAEGETKSAMEKALKLSGLTSDEINQSFLDLMEALLTVDPKVTMEIAQSIWYRQGLPVLESFKQVNRTFYAAEVNELDFARPDAKDIINGWIEDKTHDKIRDMIERVDPSFAMFLVNALYFKGEWRTKFDKDRTFKGTFIQANGSQQQVNMMQKTDSVSYLSNNLFTSVELPYGQGNFNMVILLPNEGKTCADVRGQLTTKNWDSWMKSYSPVSELMIFMPSFKNEIALQLNDALKAMGMEVAFTSEADFSGMTGSPLLAIDYVQHNTFIEVNEDGTEAAAATVVGMFETSAGTTPQVFMVNRPFVFAITERSTGAILFMGQMNSI